MDMKRQNWPVLSTKRAIFALFANAVRKTHLFSGHYLSFLMKISITVVQHRAGRRLCLINDPRYKYYSEGGPLSGAAFWIVVCCGMSAV